MMEGFGEKSIKTEQPIETREPENSPEVEENINRIRLEAEYLENASQEKEKETTLGKLRRTLAKKTSVALVGLSALALFSAYPSEARAEDNESLFNKVKDAVVWFRHDDQTSRERVRRLEDYQNRKAAKERQRITHRKNYERRKLSPGQEIKRVKEENERQEKIFAEKRGEKTAEKAASESLE